MSGNNVVRVECTRVSGVVPCLLGHVREILKQPDHGNIVVLMPENLTLNGEIELIEGLSLKGLLGIQVLSPKSFRREIWDRAGASEVEPITDFGRALVISHVLKVLARENALTFYNNAIRQTSLPTKLAEQIDEFRDAGLTPESLMELATNGSVSEAMGYKYSDISRIWSRYLKEIDHQFIDSRQQWDDLLLRFGTSHFFDGIHLFITGFSSLDAQLIRLVCQAAPLAESVRFILVADDSSGDARIFSGINDQILSMGQTLFDHGIRMERFRFTPPSKGDSGIHFIEKTLFAGGHRENLPDMQNVEVYNARTPFIECQHVAETLIRWHNQGIRWREMAVAFQDADILPSLLPMVLSDAGIPCTAPNGQSMLMNDYVQFLLAVVRVVCLGFQQRDMLELLKSGFTSLTLEETMDMENYVIEHGITRQKWLHPFPVPEENPEEAALALQMEEIRNLLVHDLVTLREVLANRKSTGEDAARAIYNTMIESGAYEELKIREAAYIERNMMLEVDRDRQVWDAVNDVLDQMATYSSKHHIAMEELPVMLESAFSSTVVKSLPQTSDAVTLHQTGIFYSSTLRGMIIVGMQDRESGSDTSLISDVERQTLRTITKSRIGSTRIEKASREMVDMINSIGVTLEKLVLSCSLTKPDGSVLYPSSVLRMVSTMLKRAGCEDQIGGGIMEDGITPYSPSSALERIAIKLRDALQGEDDFLQEAADANQKSWQQALSYLYQQDAWKEKTRHILSALSARVKSQDISSDKAHDLYPETSLSISRLETFASCPYQHFVKYGLRPVVRQPFSFMSNMKGDFYHSAMEGYVRKAASLPNWPNLTRQEVDAILDDVLAPLIEQWKDGPLDEDTLSRFLGRRIVQDVRSAAYTITRNFSLSQFEPRAYELRFGRGESRDMKIPPLRFSLEDRTRITLIGQIDRLDIFQTLEGQSYFRVVDYKSSEHDLRNLKMQEGLQLQIPIYMNAVQNAMPGTIPAGGLYQVIRNPLIDAPDEDIDRIEAKQLDSLKLKGIVLDDPAILDAMGTIDKGKKSQEKVSVVSSEKITERMQNGLDKAKELTGKIFDGCIQIAPVKYDENSEPPCTYCDFKAVCGIDRRLPGGRPTVLKPGNALDREDD